MAGANATKTPLPDAGHPPLGIPWPPSAGAHLQQVAGQSLPGTPVVVTLRNRLATLSPFRGLALRIALLEIPLCRKLVRARRGAGRVELEQALRVLLIGGTIAVLAVILDP